MQDSTGNRQFLGEEEKRPLFDKKRVEQLNLSDAFHPILCLVHLGLKIATILAYLFLRLVTRSSVYTFIITILISALHFWIVKNISGRILVGLRWWHNDYEMGQNEWYFESFNVDQSTGEVDKSVFWLGLISSTAFWGVMLVMKTLSLSFFWGMLVGICFAMNSSNLYGYYLCRKDHQEKMKRFMKEFSSYYQDFGKAMKRGFNGTMNPGNNNNNI